MFRKLLDSGEAGDIGALLRGVERDDVERGQVLCKPGSITPQNLSVRLISKKEEEEDTLHFLQNIDHNFILELPM